MSAHSSSSPCSACCPTKSKYSTISFQQGLEKSSPFFLVCRACLSAWKCKSPAQRDDRGTESERTRIGGFVSKLRENSCGPSDTTQQQRYPSIRKPHSQQPRWEKTNHVFIFNHFQNAPSATPFLSWFCIFTEGSPRSSRKVRERGNSGNVFPRDRMAMSQAANTKTALSQAHPCYVRNMLIVHGLYGVTSWRAQEAF